MDTYRKRVGGGSVRQPPSVGDMRKENIMNNLYSWHDEKMVSLKMQEIDREVKEIRLLREAEKSNPGWLARNAEILGGMLIRLGEKLQKRNSAKQNSARSNSAQRFSSP